MANNENKNLTKVEPKEQSASERFTNLVIKEFSSGVGNIELTDFQKRIAQNYFMVIDSVLKDAETKRLAKKKDPDPMPITWKNVNMEQLARNVVTYARIGLDPMQKNHIHMIPFKNNSQNKYDIGFIEGYRGIELKAKKYGLDVPDAVIVELVYTKDKFKAIKKDHNNKYESYEFEIVDPFDRGEIKGGFYYHIYSKAPTKNKLVVFTMKDILKRKPKYASVEFWGGEKVIWENGQKVGKEEHEGWFEKMCHKTIFRAAYNDITIDSQKIDDDYIRAKQHEQYVASLEVEAEIEENANKQPIDIIQDDYVIDDKPEPDSGAAQSSYTTPPPPPPPPDAQDNITEEEPY